MGTVEVVEYTDPGCSWAWGAEPILRRLRWCHGDAVRWRTVMGGLFADMRDHNPDFDPVALAPHFARYWEVVSETTGMPFPADLRWVYWSTEPSCRAVKAAEMQGEEAAREVLRRLREATFVFGAPPDTPGRIADAIEAARGVDAARLLDDLADPEVEAAYRADWEETRDPVEQVRDLVDEEAGSGAPKETGDGLRYAFPTVVVRGPGGERAVAGWKPYEAYVEALRAVAPDLGEGRPPPSPDEALAQAGSITERELDVLCGGGPPPSGAVRIDAGGGAVWLDPAVAAARSEA